MQLGIRTGTRIRTTVVAMRTPVTRTAHGDGAIRVLLLGLETQGVDLADAGGTAHERLYVRVRAVTTYTDRIHAVDKITTHGVRKEVTARPQCRGVR